MEIIILSVILVLAVIVFILYNSIIGKKNQIENAEGGLDAHLKQRYDLIPNLVESVKQYMNHEAGTLEKIVNLRSQAMQSNISEQQKQNYNQQISKELSGLVVQFEQYPELKASANFQNLQSTLYEVEQNISASRRFYNAAVTDYNNALEMFPTNIIAGKMKLQRRQVFEIAELERQNPSIKKMFGN